MIIGGSPIPLHHTHTHTENGMLRKHGPITAAKSLIDGSNPHRGLIFEIKCPNQMFYLREKPQEENCCGSCAESDDVKDPPPRFAVFFFNAPMSGHLDDHAFSLLPWRNPWHFIYSSFSSFFFLRCEKITSQHLWHFTKQNYFLLFCVLHFCPTPRETLDPENKQPQQNVYWKRMF